MLLCMDGIRRVRLISEYDSVLEALVCGSRLVCGKLYSSIDELESRAIELMREASELDIDLVKELDL